jgi:hypothetical protein
MTPTARRGYICRDCLHFDGAACRRLPPTWAPWPTDNQHPVLYMPVASFPNVKPTDWCGEWRSDKS